MHTIVMILVLVIGNAVGKEPATHSQFTAHQYPLDEAEFIIQKSYAESYARMQPCNDEYAERDCIALVVEHLNRRNNSTNSNTPTEIQKKSHFQVPENHPYPWWFQTLLRDIPSNGAYGWWHHFSTVATDSPGLRFCAIGKNGSTEWRKVFRDMNYPELCDERGGRKRESESECKSGFRTKKKLSDDPSVTPRTVFIRDPLERLLSGYLDKCFKPNIRIQQGHCAPNVVFGVDHLEWKAAKGQKQQRKRQQQQQEEDDKEDAPIDLTNVIQGMDKEMFAAYVDLFPLKWNVHFVPQAIFCDLYRHIDSYDVFVMGKQFMSELDRMANRYGGMFPEVLNNIFRYQSSLNNESKVTTLNVGADNSHGTRASAKVARYYSARTVRKALEYLSIDYIVLGLEVPEWAREMLRDDILV